MGGNNASTLPGLKYLSPSTQTIDKLPENKTNKQLASNGGNQSSMTLDQQQATQTNLAATNNPPPPRNTRYGEQKRKAKKVAEKH